MSASASASASGRLGDSGSGIEPELKRRRLLDAGGPVEDDETARLKMREAEVYTSEGDEIAGFDPDSVSDKKHKYICDHRRRDEYVITAMGYFAGEGDLRMMRWLYLNGADTRDEDVDFWFPMYAAARGGKVGACKWLFDHGAALDIKRRCRSEFAGNFRPLQAASTFNNDTELIRWLILNGALYKDSNAGALDINLLTEDLRESSLSRVELLAWANEERQCRNDFAVFLQGTLHVPMPSPQKLLSELTKRNRSECAAKRILENTPAEQYELLWDDLHHTPVKFLLGKRGILELISEFSGVMRGREALIFRQLREILPDIIVSEDESWDSDGALAIY